MKNRQRSFTSISTVTIDDKRLLVAGVPVLLLANLLLGLLIAPYLPFPIWEPQQWLKQESENHRIYPVLIKQPEPKPTQQIDQKRALSEINASGQGGITKRLGFHTLSNSDSLRIPIRNNLSSREQWIQSKGLSSKAQSHYEKAKIEEIFPISYTNDHNKVNKKENAFPLRVPANYRFRQDFLLRFDSSSLIALASQKLVGFTYFRNMLSQIQKNFAPPGINYIIYDHFGHILNQPIVPQVVQVAFTLDREGNVSDVRKLSSIGQALVDEACIQTLQGQNFGKPPLAIFAKGNIFGINFVFPDLRR